MESKLIDKDAITNLKPITSWRQVKAGDKVVCILVPRDIVHAELVLGRTYTVVESIASPYGFVGRDLVELAGDGGCYHCYRFALAPKEDIEETKETKEEQGNN